MNEEQIAFYKKILGEELFLSDWRIYKTKESVKNFDILEKEVFRKVYQNKEYSREYSIGVYSVKGKIKIIAFGPVGTCVGHVFLDESSKYVEWKEGCIDFEKFKLTLEK